MPASTGAKGPSGLTFQGRSKDSRWSVGIFRCESLTLKSLNQTLLAGGVAVEGFISYRKQPDLQFASDGHFSPDDKLFLARGIMLAYDILQYAVLHIRGIWNTWCSQELSLFLTLKRMKE